MTPTRTNPAYAHIAYRKAIAKRMSVYLHRSFLGDEIGEPQEVILCEEVFPVDQQVPVEEIQRYIEGLNEEVANLDLELRKFSLTKDISNDGESQTKKGRGGRSEKSRRRRR